MNSFIVSYKQQKIVAYWLLLGAFFIIIQILLGGITRITESGLSITEWNPITGSIPPFNQNDWIILFEKYQYTDQYQHLKYGISLEDFKYLFFWEWVHRNWARAIGLTFVIPYIYFIVKKYLTLSQIKNFLSLFVLGALQGLMGWLMVKTGLQKGNVFVSPIFLCLHFLLALMNLATCIYFALQILIPKEKITIHKKLYQWHFIFFILISVQLFFGAIMAGLHAATAAATWPTINGEYFPSTMWKLKPLLSNIIYNPIFVHFVHRNLAYVILIFGFISWYKTKGIPFYKSSLIRKLVIVFLVIQITIGIFTVLVSPDYLMMRSPAVLHQFVGMLLFVTAFMNIILVRKK